MSDDPFNRREWLLIQQAVKQQRFSTNEYAQLHHKVSDHVAEQYDG